MRFGLLWEIRFLVQKYLIKMKNWEIGAISGGLAGIVGAWLASDYDFSLFSIVLIGAVIGICVGLITNFIKRRKK